MAVLGDRDPSVGLLDVGDQLGEPVTGIRQGKLFHSQKLGSFSEAESASSG
jgi:hypothetical protein